MKKRFQQFSIGFLLLLTAAASVLVVSMNYPLQHARRIVEAIDDFEPAWEQEYLSDEIREMLNDKIPGTKNDIPECTFGFEAEIIPRTLTDILVMRQPIRIAYTANPIPPEWQGAITRYQTMFSVGMNEMRQTSESKNEVSYYFD